MNITSTPTDYCSTYPLPRADEFISFYYLYGAYDCSAELIEGLKQLLSTVLSLKTKTQAFNESLDTLFLMVKKDIFKKTFIFAIQFVISECYPNLLEEESLHDKLIVLLSLYQSEENFFWMPYNRMRPERLANYAALFRSYEFYGEANRLDAFQYNSLLVSSFENVESDYIYHHPVYLNKLFEFHRLSEERIDSLLLIRNRYAKAIDYFANNLDDLGKEYTQTPNSLVARKLIDNICSEKYHKSPSHPVLINFLMHECLQNLNRQTFNAFRIMTRFLFNYFNFNSDFGIKESANLIFKNPFYPIIIKYKKKGITLDLFLEEFPSQNIDKIKIEIVSQLNEVLKELNKILKEKKIFHSQNKLTEIPLFKALVRIINSKILPRELAHIISDSLSDFQKLQGSFDFKINIPMSKEHMDFLTLENLIINGNYEGSENSIEQILQNIETNSNYQNTLFELLCSRVRDQPQTFIIKNIENWFIISPFFDRFSIWFQAKDPQKFPSLLLNLCLFKLKKLCEKVKQSISDFDVIFSTLTPELIEECLILEKILIQKKRVSEISSLLKFVKSYLIEFKKTINNFYIEPNKGAMLNRSHFSKELQFYNKKLKININLNFKVNISLNLKLFKKFSDKQICFKEYFEDVFINYLNGSVQRFETFYKPIFDYFSHFELHIFFDEMLLGRITPAERAYFYYLILVQENHSSIRKCKLLHFIYTHPNLLRTFISVEKNRFLLDKLNFKISEYINSFLYFDQSEFIIIDLKGNIKNLSDQFFDSILFSKCDITILYKDQSFTTSFLKDNINLTIDNEVTKKINLNLMDRLLKCLETKIFVRNNVEIRNFENIIESFFAFEDDSYQVENYYSFLINLIHQKFENPQAYIDKLLNRLFKIERLRDQSQGVESSDLKDKMHIESLID